MKMTKACEYGLQGILYLAMQPEGKTALLSEISEARTIPYSFLGKIFRHLVKSGIIKSIRGVHGGFTLARTPREITMKDVVEAVEGDIAFSQCSSKNIECHRIDCCAMAEPWREAQHNAFQALEKVNFETLAEKEKQYVRNEKK